MLSDLASRCPFRLVCVLCGTFHCFLSTSWHSGKRICLTMQETWDVGLMPGLGRSLSGGNGNSFQYSCLENPLDRGAWRATVHGIAKSQTQLSVRDTASYSRAWVLQSMYFSVLSTPENQPPNMHLGVQLLHKLSSSFIFVPNSPPFSELYSVLPVPTFLGGILQYKHGWLLIFPTGAFSPLAFFILKSYCCFPFLSLILVELCVNNNTVLQEFS